LFAGKDMKLYVTNELHNTEDANIFAYNNLIIAKDTSNNKTNKIINDKDTIQTYQGDIDIYAKLLENKTDIPSITGSYDADTQTIVGGEIVSENTVTKVTTDCGGSCRDEITTTIKRMGLNSRGAPAQLISGGNMKLMVDKNNNPVTLTTLGSQCMGRRQTKHSIAKKSRMKKDADITKPWVNPGELISLNPG
jgi:hypothetical protein